MADEDTEGQKDEVTFPKSQQIDVGIRVWTAACTLNPSLISDRGWDCEGPWCLSAVERREEWMEEQREKAKS